MWERQSAILNAESGKKKKKEKSCNRVLYNCNWLNGTNKHHTFVWESTR